MTVDFEFRKQVMDYHIGSDLIKYCYQCSRCADNCPITKVTTDFYTTTGYNPRSNILNALLGYKDAIFAADALTIWGCTVCDTCDEVCPQNIELTEIFTLLKNQSVANGNAPDFIYSQAKAIFDSAKAIPTQPAIERRREQLGLPPVAEPDVSELQTLLKNIGADKKLK
ncbi:MAG TPA: 4Fe-4S dicluster domain-containing protein [Candidatus Nanopelagicaceae bacterium]|nr:4Fe-4S dicluster domain-containing protein [Candidatus Nanopelagicaceae bacterium]